MNAAVGRALRGRGWVPRVLPQTGYGADGWVRVLARVLLAPPGTPREALDARGWRHFLTPSASGRPGDGPARRGHARRDDGLRRVRRRATAERPAPGLAVGDADGRRPPTGRAPLRVGGPETRLGLLSDIDDTVIVTMLPRPLVAFRNAFLVRGSDRRRGARHGRRLPRGSSRRTRTPSWCTSRPAPGTTAGTLIGFLARHGYPRRAAAAHRLGPDPGRLVPVRAGAQAPPARAGSSRSCHSCAGCWSATTASTTRRCTPRRRGTTPAGVAAVAIRQLSTAEQVAGHGTPRARDAGSPEESGPPFVTGPDGAALRAGLRGSGVLT